MCKGDIAMATYATVAFHHNQFVAVLSDGWCVERPDFRTMAEALVHAGVRSCDVQFEWKAGQRMITAGQQVGLRSQMRHLEREYASVLNAA
jgi:hypothetical protein